MPFRLVRSEPKNVDHVYFNTFRFRLEVVEVEGDGLDPYVFVYLQEPKSPYNDNPPCATFQAIVGMAQLDTIPILEPDPLRSWPYFRLDWVELDFPSLELAEKTIKTIERELTVLSNGMERFRILSRVSDRWIPAKPCPQKTASPWLGKAWKEASHADSE